MATLIDLPNLREGYITLVDRVAKDGRSSSPRGLPIVELNDVTFTVADTTNVLPIGVGRDLNTSVAAVEALQLQAGIATPSLLLAIAPQFENYREPDGDFHGAYGLRIGFQADEVIAKLEADRETRQAIITLWNPALDNEPGKRDYPCTIALGFRIRDDRLDASVLMRSNDVWLGTAYDVFQFTQLQWCIANYFDIRPGTYTHTAWSLHIYERDLPRLAKLHPPARVELPWRHPTGLSSDGIMQWDELADELLTSPRSLQPNLTIDASARWYLTRVLDAYDKLEKTNGNG